MRNFSSLALACIGGVLLAGAARADECCSAKLTATHETLTAEAVHWEKALGKFRAMPAAERSEHASELMKVAAACPVGSRMGKTFAGTHQVLTAVLAAEGGAAEAPAGAGCCSSSSSQAVSRRQLLTDLVRVTGGMGQVMHQVHAAAEPVTTVAASFCPTKAQTLAKAVRECPCDQTAAKMVVAQIPGLSCETAAAKVVADIRGSGCETSAAKVVLTAAAAHAKPAPVSAPDGSCSKEGCPTGGCGGACPAGSCAGGSCESKTVATATGSCTKSGATGSCSEGTTVVSAPAESFCPTKAQTLAKAVRECPCDQTAAKMVVAQIPGLSCETAAAKVVADIRGSGCETSAAKVVLTAAAAHAKPAPVSAGAGTCSKTAACGAAVAGAKAPCFKTLARQVGELHAEWDRASVELVSLPSDRLEGLRSRMREISKSCEVTRHMPRTVARLSDGLAVVLGTYGEADDATRERVAVLRETHRLLERVRKATGAATGEEPKVAGR